jgi:hypothetical protein
MTQSVVEIPINKMHLVEVSGEHSATGSEARFYEMKGNKYGIKLYKDLDVAEKTYERQKIANLHGLAPKVGRFLLIRKKESGILFFGYETEKARDIDLRNKYDLKIWKEQSEKLYQALKLLKMSGDFDDINCGVIGNKLVAVDFGTHSKGSW